MRRPTCLWPLSISPSQYLAPAVSTVASRTSRPRALARSAGLAASLLFSAVGRAQPAQPVEAGIAWLHDDQDVSGAWSPGANAAAARDTVEVLELFTALALDDESFQNGLLFLENHPAGSFDLEARRAGLFGAVDPQLRQALLQQQNADGGWGLAAGYSASDVRDTALVVHAFCEATPDLQTAAIAALDWLVARQHTDGSFAEDDNDPDIPTTADALRALACFEPLFAGTDAQLTQAIDNAAAYLRSRQQPDGSFSPDDTSAGTMIDTALALRALIEAGRTVDAFGPGESFLQGKQRNDGSWSDDPDPTAIGDPFTTAVAVDALRHGQPDLSIVAEDVGFSDNSPVAGDVVTVTVTVRNLGLADVSTSDPFEVRLLRGSPTQGALIGTQMVSGLLQGGSAPLTYSWDTTGLQGGQQISVVVDPGGAVAEQREDNNARTLFVSVEPHLPLDLKITGNDIRFQPERARVDENVTLSATVYNTGDDVATGVIVRFYDGEPSVDTFLAAAPAIEVGARGSAVATIPARTFSPVGTHPIYAVVDEANAIAEAHEDNNRAFKPLVITEDVDLELGSSAMKIEPSGNVLINSTVTVFASVTNLGSVTANNVNVRFYRGNPKSGGTALGDVALGALGGRESRTASLAVAVGPTPGALVIVAVADPDDHVKEFRERNNQGTATAQVVAPSDLTVGSSVPYGNPISRGDTLTFSTVEVRNQGALPAQSVRFRVTDGAAGPVLAPDRVIPSIPGGTTTSPGVWRDYLQIDTGPMTPGIHTIHFAADPLDAIVETDETNNTLDRTQEIRPLPDLAATEITFDPTSPEEGDVVAIHARVQNLEPTTIAGCVVSPCTWKVRIFHGDAATGVLLGESSVAGWFPASFDQTFSATFESDGHQGDNAITVEVDREAAIRDGNRSNNTVSDVLAVGAATHPDLEVTPPDIASDPVDPEPGQPTQLTALVSNDRNVAASGVGVTFSLGDPDAGGQVIGVDYVDVPARGTTVASVPWDTSALGPGDQKIYVVLDRAGDVDEADETNNKAARDIELRLLPDQRPVSLDAVPGQNLVDLTWQPGNPNSLPAGYHVFRDGGVLASGAPDVQVPNTTATAIGSPGTEGAQYAIDPYTGANSYWQATPPQAGQPDPYLEVVYGEKRFVTEVDLIPGWAKGSYDIETWDGVAFTKQAQGSFDTGGGLPPQAVRFPAPVRTGRIRITVRPTSYFRLQDVKAFALAPVTANPGTTPAFTDGDLHAGSYTYRVAAVDSTGHISRDSDPDTADVAAPQNATGFAATVDGNDATLSWTPSGQPNVGTYLRRSGAMVNQGNDNITQSGTVRASSENPNYPGTNAVDSSASTGWQPADPNAPPWTFELSFPERHYVRRLDLTMSQDNRPGDFTIDTWDGTQFVTQLTVANNPRPPSSTQPVEYSLPQPVKTTRVRIRITASCLGCYVSQLNDIKVQAVAPLAPATSTFLDSNLVAGTYAYTLTTEDSYRDESAPAEATATVGRPAAPTNLQANVSGSDVNLTWTANPAPDIVGYRVLRDGQEAGPGGDSVARQATPTSAVSNPTWAIDVDPNNQPNYDTTWDAYLNLGDSIELMLDFTSSRTIAALTLRRHTYYGGGNCMKRRVQFWDGAAFVTRYQDSGVPPVSVSANIVPAATTTRVRIILDKGTGTQCSSWYEGLADVQLKAAAMVSGTTHTDAGVSDGTYTYGVVAVDDAGNVSDPAEAPATVGGPNHLVPPTDVVASLSGEDVTITFTPSTSPSSVGSHVYRNGDRVSTDPVMGGVFTDAVSRLGTYRYWVTAVAADGHESGPSETATVDATSLPPPSPPTGVGVSAPSGIMNVSWAANAPGDLVASYRVLLDGALYATVGSGQLSVQVPFQYGKPSYSYTVVAVDLDGQASAPSVPAVYTQPAPQPPTNLQASVVGSLVTVGYTPPSTPPSAQLRGYLLRRDGTPTMPLAHVWGTNTASSNNGTAWQASDTGHDPSAPFDSNDASYWASSPGEASPWLQVDLTNPPQRVDRLSLSWLSETQRGVNFEIQAWDGSAWVPKVVITGSTDLQAVYDLPAGTITSRLRLLVTGTADPTQAVGVRGFFPLAYPLDPPPLTDTPPPGTYSYTIVTEDIVGQRSAPSEPNTATIAGVDLVLAPRDIDFGADVVTMNQDVTVTARVRNTGTQPASGVVVQFKVGSLSAAPFASAVVDVPAGGLGEASVPWTVSTVTENVYAIADPDGLIAESNEDNNSAGRGPPAAWPVRTYFYNAGVENNAQTNLTLFGYTDDTTFVIRDALGTIVTSGAVDHGDHFDYQLAPVGAYQAFGSHKFSLLVGGHRLGAVSYFAMDEEGRGASKELMTVTTSWAEITNGGAGQTPNAFFGVFSYAPGNHVVVSDLDTPEVYFTGILDKGQHFSNRLFPPFKNLHIVADSPVTALSWADMGHVVPSGDGRWIGKEFYTWLPGTFRNAHDIPPDPLPSSLLVFARQPGTSVVVEDSDTHALLASADDLAAGEMLPFTNQAYADRFVTVTATYDVSVEHAYFAVPNDEGGGFAQGTPAAGDSGALLGRHLSTTMVDSGGFLAVLSYFDNTVVEATETVFDFTYSPGLSSPSPQLILTLVTTRTTENVLDDGGLLDLAQPPGQVGNDLFIDPDPRPRIWRLTSNRPVSAYAGGPPPLALDWERADAEFRAPMFGSTAAADLEVLGSDIVLSNVSPEMGEHVSVTAKVHNLGENVAENFTVDVYDGDPAQGGERLHREYVDSLYSDEELGVDADWEAVPGAHRIYVVADLDGQVDEIDETNNIANVVVQTPPNLVVQAEDLAVIPASPLLAGAETTLHAVVRNDGGRMVELGDVEFWDGDPAAGGKVIAARQRSFLPGDALEFEVPWDTASLSGTHTIHVIADRQNYVAETVEDDNAATLDIEFTDPQAPDLRVVDLTVQPPSPFSGATATATVTVENIGRATGPAGVRLSDGTPVGPDQSTPVLLQAGRASLGFSWRPSAAGPHTLVATVDPNDAVAEADENNNTRTLDVVVADPQLTVSVTTGAAEYVTGAVVGGSVTLTNTAGARDGTLVVTVLDEAGLLVAVVEDEALSLATGDTTVPVSWDSDGTLPADYRLHADWREAGTPVAEGDASFTLTGDAQVAGSIFPDRLRYGAHETAVLTSTIENVGLVSPLEDLAATVDVLDGSSVVVFTDLYAVPPIPAGDWYERESWFPTETKPPGTYTARLTVTEGGTAALVREATFDIRPSTEIGIAIEGTVTVAPDPVDQGIPLVVSNHLENVGNVDLLSVKIVTTLMDPPAPGLVSSFEYADIAKGAVRDGSATFASENLPLGDMLAVVEARTNERVLFSKFVPFTVIDLTPPVVTIDVPACTADDVNPVITVIERNPGSEVRTLDTLPYDNDPITSDTPSPHTLVVTATDTSGNQGSATASFIIDHTPPTITVQGVTDGTYYNTPVTPSVIYTDTNLVSSSATLTDANNNSYPVGQQLTGDGHYTLTATASDCAGHTTSVTVSFVVDRTAPVVSIQVPACTAATSVTPAVTVTEVNPYTQVWNLDGNANFPVGGAVTSEGSPHTLVVTATDAAGNAGSKTVSFIMDWTQPQITITGVQDGGVYANPVSPNVACTDLNLASCSATLTGPSGIPAPFYNGGPPLDVDGPYTLSATATDCAGNSRTVTVNFEIQQLGGDVAQVFSTKSHVLLLADCPCTWLAGLYAHLVCSAALFEDAQIRNDWRTKLRSGRFNGYFMYKPVPPGGDTDLFGELAEVNWIGEGLIVIDNANVVLYPTQPYLKEPLGVSRKGSTTVTSVQLLTPLKPAGQADPYNIGASGTAQTFTLLTASTAAKKTGTSTIVGAYNLLGTGKTVTMGWDTETSTSWACALYRDSITAVSPTQPDLVPKAQARLKVTVTNTTTQSLYYKVDHTLQSGLTAEDPTTHDLGLIAGGAPPTDFEMRIRLPNSVGTFTVTATLSARKAPTDPWTVVDTDTFNLVVPRDAAALSTAINNYLNSLTMPPLPSPPLTSTEITARDNAVIKVNSALGRANAQDAITDTIAAIGYVRSIASQSGTTNMKTCRTNLMLLLRTYELRWPP
jgi:subtilase family serine protease